MFPGPLLVLLKWLPLFQSSETGQEREQPCYTEQSPLDQRELFWEQVTKNN